MTVFCPEWTSDDKRSLIEIIETKFPDIVIDSADEENLFMTLTFGDKSAEITSLSCVSINDNCIIVNTGSKRVFLG